MRLVPEMAEGMLQADAERRRPRIARPYQSNFIVALSIYFLVDASMST
jgi:hypothetical protein